MEGKIHLVKWEVVCTNKDKGGSGLRKLALLNKALLGKWIWRYACDKDNLWKQVIKSSVGKHDIPSGEGHHDQILDRCVVFRISVVSLFSSSLGMAAQRNSTVEEMWDQNSGQGNWNLNFLRDFNDWELDLVGDFLHILRGYKPHWRKTQFCGGKEKWVPTKVAFFAWEATWGKVLTLDRLQRRVVRALWDIVFGLVDVKWVFPETVKEF
ncbi:hypothetical protein CK203_097314 [Vitis vinifera]|uniref:Uncharacterized protein n=1 Tax=Vitis vinifera TaxID=29760 RepID=A0A438D695_VITVI|nr:hypothetical protein CK203_097314 [Vitis vinifera]